MGYSRAGFKVVGVDNQRQLNYPFKFQQDDALSYLTRLLRSPRSLRRYAAIHASPPCQTYTAYRRTGLVGEYPALIAETRYLLNETGLPWVMENVIGAPLRDPVMFCATMFDPAPPIQRHRLFETNWPLDPPEWPCRHKLNGKDNYPGGRSVERTGHSRGKVRATMEIGSWDIRLAEQQEAMGVDWMNLEELSEAIPPSYTLHIGEQLLAYLQFACVRCGDGDTLRTEEECSYCGL